MIEKVFALLDDYNLCLVTGEVLEYYENLDELFYENGEDAEYIILEIQTICEN